jgi:hypothetical protein
MYGLYLCFFAHFYSCIDRLHGAYSYLPTAKLVMKYGLKLYLFLVEKIIHVSCILEEWGEGGGASFIDSKKARSSSLI